MKIPVSWSTYIGAVLILCGLYYLIVLLVYYRKDILSFTWRKKTAPSIPYASVSPTIPPPPSSNQSAVASPLVDVSSAVHDFTDALKVLLLQLASHRADRLTISTAIHQLLQNYASLKESPFKEALTNLIVRECADKCSVVLDEQEQISLWQ